MNKAKFIEMELFHQLDMATSEKNINYVEDKGVIIENTPLDPIHFVEEDAIPISPSPLDEAYKGILELNGLLKVFSNESHFDEYNAVTVNVGFKKFIKKVTRKFISWYIKPISTKFNQVSQIFIGFNAKLKDIVTLQGEQIKLNIEQIKLIKEQFKELERLRISLTETISQINTTIDKELAHYVKHADLFIYDNNLQKQLSLYAIDANVGKELAYCVKHTDLSKYDETIQKQLSQYALKKELTYCVKHTDLSKYDETIQKQISQINNEPLNINYLDFENKFRGEISNIKERLKCYLPELVKCKKVIDLGCGRGEMLELLQEHSINVIGVDSNESMVRFCTDRGLNAKYADMFEYLNSLPDNSCDGITAIQVIEHLKPNQLIRLFDLCYSKLKDDGVVIFETQNPYALYTYTYFYTDPSHIFPVTYNLASYIAERAGFNKCRLFERPGSDYPSLFMPKLELLPSNHDYNEKMEIWNKIFFGPTDYAIIARK